MHSSRCERLMDGLGFFTTLGAAIREKGSSADYFSSGKRHLSYFNGGIYLSSAVVGAVANMEKRRETDLLPDEERVERVKAALSSVLAARANNFFDAHLIPLGLTITCIFAMYGSCLGLLIFLALYNFYHFRSRISGYCKGLELGEGVGMELVSRLFAGERVMELAASFASGVFSALLFARSFERGRLSLVSAGAGVFCATVILRRRFSPTACSCILATVAVIFLFVLSIL